MCFLYCYSNPTLLEMAFQWSLYLTLGTLMNFILECRLYATPILLDMWVGHKVNREIKEDLLKLSFGAS